MNTRLKGIACPRCKYVGTPADAYDGCPRCKTQNIAVNMATFYDFSQDTDELKAAFLSESGPGIWRHRAFLPVDDSVSPVTIGEGNTPLLHCKKLGKILGLNNLYIKNESVNPSWSFKDRLCSVGVTRAVQDKASTITVSSTGNHGAAAAAYAAAAGIPCIVFTLTEVPPVMKMLMQAYGAYVFALDEPNDRWKIMEWCVKNLGWFPMSGYNTDVIGSNCYAVDGYKTISFELFEQLQDLPDYIVVPNAYSDGLFGIWKGVQDLRAIGLTDKKCRMVSAEVLGSLKRTFDQKSVKIIELEYLPSVASSIATNIGTWQGYTALIESDGLADVAADNELLEMQLLLAKNEGIYAEISSVSSLVVAEKLAKAKQLHPDDSIVAIITSSGLKFADETISRSAKVPIIKADPEDLFNTAKNIYSLDLK